MSKWNTNFDELPDDEWVFIQYKNGRNQYLKVKASFDSNNAIAWHPSPEPYRPPKPQQLTPEELWGLTSRLACDLDIKAVEERTREIVAWELKHGGGK